ncbi:protein of unknown function (plasmid) [Caballeronia sp. S22]
MMRIPTERVRADMIDADIRAAIDSPSTSYWLRDALASVLRRDCVDAARDAHALAALLGRRCDAIIGRREGVSDAKA